MSIPAVVLDVFAAIMLTVAAVSAARLAAARPWRGGAARGDADIDGAHLLMGVAMAGMLAPVLSTVPAGAWEAAFGVVAAWFAVRVWREAGTLGLRAVARSHHAPHLVHASAMLYMFAALTAPAAAAAGQGGGMAGGADGMGTLQVPTLALAFTVILAGYAVTDLDRLTVSLPRLRPAGALAPELALAPSATAAGTVPALPAEGGALAGASDEGGSLGGEPEAGDGPGHGRAAGLLDRRVATGCRIAMGITMALMLVIAI